MRTARDRLWFAMSQAFGSDPPSGATVEVDACDLQRVLRDYVTLDAAFIRLRAATRAAVDSAALIDRGGLSP